MLVAGEELGGREIDGHVRTLYVCIPEYLKQQ